MRDTLLLQKVRLCTAGVSPAVLAGSPYQPIPVAQNVPQQIAAAGAGEPARRSPG